MARVVFASAAYLGDVAPYIPPANLLAARGHDVTFVAPEGFRTVLSGERFAYAPYPLDFSPRAMHADPHHERLMRHPYRNAAQLVRYWMRMGFAAEPARARDALLEAFAGADVVVSHPTFASAAAPVAQHLGIPVVVGQLFPMMVPTREWCPPIGARSPDLGSLLNRFAWRAMREGTHLWLCDKEINAVRVGLGLEPLRGAALVSWMTADRTVILCSQQYYGREAADWPPLRWGGFSVWEGPAGQEIPPEIDAFVDGGEPPVLVTLGTSAATNAGEQFAAMAAGLDALGLRSVLLVGHAGNLEPLRGRPGVAVFAPMTRLLPRCRVAVVSGALGALAAALVAGVPVVVVPQLFDQVWHGGRVEELGVGVMARKPRQVADAVRRIEADPGYRQRAAALAATMAAEDGAAVLADAVEATMTP